MTKRRRKKINKIMSNAFPYVEKGKFAYLYRQAELYRKHAKYLVKHSSRNLKRNLKRFTEDYLYEEDR